MTYPEDPSQQPPQQPGFPPPQGGPAYPPPQGGPAYPPPQGGPAYPPPPPPPQDTPAYPPPPPQGAPGYPPAPPPQGAPGYPPPPAGAPPYGYGQGVPPGMYFDPESGLTLPVGTQLAPVGRRIGAWFLSFLLVIVTLVIGWIIWGLIVWGRGQTPALQVLGMRVWRPTEQRVAPWGYMALREIVGRIVDGILSIITQLISFIMMLTGKERKTLHDMVAGTVVLYDPNKVLAG